MVDIKNIAENLEKGLRDDLEIILSKKIVPKLVSVISKNDPSTCIYANSQKRFAQRLGINYECIVTDPDIDLTSFRNILNKLNSDSSVSGIMLCRPISDKVKFCEVASLISAKKDVEGVSPENLGKLFLGQNSFVSPVALSCFEIIKKSQLPLKGKDVVIVGHSYTVGKPLTALLLDKLATVNICHIGTFEAGKLEEYISRAEILIVSVGKPELIKAKNIKQGAFVVDVGINKVADKIVGDVEFSKAKDKVSYITPVPGGVGCLTTLFLFINLIKAVKIQHGI